MKQKAEAYAVFTFVKIVLIINAINCKSIVIIKNKPNIRGKGVLTNNSHLKAYTKAKKSKINTKLNTTEIINQLVQKERLVMPIIKRLFLNFDCFSLTTSINIKT